MLFLSDGGDLAFLKQMKPPLQILQAKVEIALAPDETTQVFPVPQLHCGKFIAGRDVRAGVEQRLADFVRRHFMPEV